MKSTLGQVRNDNLGVGLGAERTRFEQWLLVVDTSSVHVLTCLNVVESVGNTGERGEEFVAIYILRFGTDTVLVAVNLAPEVRVHLGHRRCSCVGL